MARLTLGHAALLVAGVAAASCQPVTKEGPPPAESYEVASAAPRALGALAAGTDDAPPGIRNPAPAGPEDAEPDDEDDAGAPHPDAAFEAPEDVPL